MRTARRSTSSSSDGSSSSVVTRRSSSSVGTVAGGGTTIHRSTVLLIQRTSTGWRATCQLDVSRKLVLALLVSVGSVWTGTVGLFTSTFVQGP